jgi:ribosomal protein S18 acetylase RimI-like enzyme
VKHLYYRKCGKTRVAVLDCTHKNGAEVAYIPRINTPRPYQGKGIASELLRECVADADKESIILQLEIVPSGTLSYDDLRAWYERHGFSRVYLEGYEYFVWERQPRKAIAA